MGMALVTTYCENAFQRNKGDVVLATEGGILTI